MFLRIMSSDFLALTVFSCQLTVYYPCHFVVPPTINQQSQNHLRYGLLLHLPSDTYFSRRFLGNHEGCQFLLFKALSLFNIFSCSSIKDLKLIPCLTLSPFGKTHQCYTRIQFSLILFPPFILGTATFLTHIRYPS